MTDVSIVRDSNVKILLESRMPNFDMVTFTGFYTTPSVPTSFAIRQITNDYNKYISASQIAKT